MPTSVNQNGWKTATSASVKTASGWKTITSYVKTAAGSWKPLDNMPNQGTATAARWDETANSFYRGYRKTDNDTNYPPFGAMNPEPLLINNGKVMGVYSVSSIIGGTTYITSAIAAKDRNVFNFQSVEINGVLYQRSAFQNIFPSDPSLLSVIKIDAIDFFNGVAVNAPVVVKFNL